MTTWLIGGATVGAGGKTPEQLNIESLSLRYLNQQADECAVGFWRNLDEALPSLFDDGNTVDVYRNGTRVFRGYVEDPGEKGTPKAESRTVELAGLWRVFEDTPWLYYHPNAGWRSSGSISGSVTSALQTLIASCSERITAGTVDIGDDFELPGALSISDGSSIASVITRILKLIPGAVVVFDYHELKVHVLHYTSDDMHDISASKKAIKYNRKTKLNSCSAVVLHYDRQYIFSRNNGPKTDTLVRVSSDCYPSESYGYGTFIRAKTLSGTWRRNTNEFTLKRASSTDSAYNYLYNDSNILDTIHFKHRDGITIVNPPSWGRDSSEILYNGRRDISLDAVSEYCSDFGSRNWAIHATGNDVPSEFLATNDNNNLVCIYDVTLTVDIQVFNLGGIPGYNPIQYNVQLKFRAVRIGSQGLMGSTALVERTYIEDDDEFEQAPSAGTAQAIYNALNGNVATGSITVPGWQTRRARCVKIKNFDGSTDAITPIQDLRYDLETDESSISFGSPRHLTPNEIISLRKAYN